jgi:hypothetical protein
MREWIPEKCKFLSNLICKKLSKLSLSESEGRGHLVGGKNSGWLNH